MKALKQIKSILLLFLSILLYGCNPKQPLITPDSLTRDYLRNNFSIKDFSFQNAVVNVTSEYSPQENYIVLTLPEDFKGDFITPTINLNDDASKISPKSGERVFFEGKEAIEYIVTKKNGQLVTFKLYVVRQDKLDVEVFTKEIKLSHRESPYIQFRIKNIGTISSPPINGTVKIPAIRIFDSNKQQIYFSGVNVNSNDTISAYISNSNNGYTFLKKGEFTVSFSMNEDTLFGKTRKSDISNFKIVNGENELISTFERAWSLNSDNIIKGVNFDSKKNYKVIFENEFLNAPITISPKFIDENTLSVKIPNNIDTLQCWITFKESEKIIAEADGAITNNPKYFIKNCQFSTNYEIGFQSFIKKEQSFSFQKNKAFGAYFVVSYGNNSNDAYNKGDLKLVNIDTRNEFVLKGKIVRCIWDCTASYWSFSVPDDVPKGFYEVYGINPQVNAGRYWRKLEVK